MKYGWRLDNIKEKRNRSINGKSAEDKITSFVYEEMLADFHGEEPSIIFNLLLIGKKSMPFFILVVNYNS